MGCDFEVSGTFVIRVCMEFGVKRGSWRVLTQPYVCALRPALQNKWRGYGQVCVQAREGVRGGGVCLRARKAPDTPLESRTGTLRRPYTDGPLDQNVVRHSSTRAFTVFTPLDNNTTIATTHTLTTACRVRLLFGMQHTVLAARIDAWV